MYFKTDHANNNINIKVDGFDPPNNDQERATRSAISFRFTMIQGPPGI